MHPVLLASLLVCTLLTGCTRRVVTSSSSSAPATPNTLVEGTFITGSGSWHHRKGDIDNALQVTVSGNDISWNYTHTEYQGHGGRSSGGSGTQLRTSSPGAPWFIYVEAPTRLWLFDGKDSLSLQENHGSYNLVETVVIARGKLREGGDASSVPTDLIPRLPEELQKLFPKPTTPTGRPSI